MNYLNEQAADRPREQGDGAASWADDTAFPTADTVTDRPTAGSTSASPRDSEGTRGTGEIRRLVPARDDALPLYVQEAGSYVSKRAEELVVRPREGTSVAVRLGQTSQFSLFGGAQISTQAVQAILGRGLPICFLSHGGWFYGMATGMTHKNVELRRLQYRTAKDDGAALKLARRFIAAKIRNCRTMLRRNGDVPTTALDRLKRFADDCGAVEVAASLLGVEGSAARIYYEYFPSLVRPTDPDLSPGLDFEGRNRRPPRDPMNALLSLMYAMLVKDVTIALLGPAPMARPLSGRFPLEIPGAGLDVVLRPPLPA